MDTHRLSEPGQARQAATHRRPSLAVRKRRRAHEPCGPRIECRRQHVALEIGSRLRGPRGIRDHRQSPWARRGRQNCVIRNLHRQESRSTPGQESTHGRGDRHRVLAHAVVQGRKDAPQCRQPDALVSVRPESGRLVSPSEAMCVAGRRRWNFRLSSHARTRAQSSVPIGYPRARVPHTARCEFPTATVLHADAHTQYRTRSRRAYVFREHEPKHLIRTSTPESQLQTLGDLTGRTTSRGDRGQYRHPPPLRRPNGVLGGALPDDCCQRETV